MNGFTIPLLLALAAACACAALPPQRTSGGQLLSAPASPEDRPAWLAGLKEWRSSITFDRTLYDAPDRQWTQRNFVQALVIVQERTLYDPRTGRYTVDRYLNVVKKRYGGVDSVIIWHTYPNIGIDDRNQHDHLRDMPGGLDGVRKMVKDFHKRGVRVFFPIMPWDAGTRTASGGLAEMMAADMSAVGADGMFGDTLSGIDRSFLKGSSLVLEPELNLGDDAMLGWNTMTWGQFWDEPFAPGISAYKWLEPRHMVHVTSRWAKDRSGDMQRAFLNGTGYQSWENVWGLWNGITAKDAANLRHIAAIEREFADLLSGPGWEPYSATEQPGVYASRFGEGERTLWTLVNRSDADVSGVILKTLHRPGARYYDVWRGVELKPETTEGTAAVSLTIPAHGFGAVLAVESSGSLSLRERAGVRASRFLRKMAALPQPAGESEWVALPQRMTPITRTKPRSNAPEGMVLIPSGPYDFKVSGVEIEGSDEYGIDFQYFWEDAPKKAHNRRLEMTPFFIDRTPVTNAQFKAFVDASKYRPRDSHNFLRHWNAGTYPEGWGNKPVTWVSLEDARAYARWAKKRLPHEWEWQYAAQGTDGRLYPWGSQPDAGAMPPADTGRTMRLPTDVDAYPSGASPFGVLDLVGNVWQWTDEYTDDHTRAAVLRGGCYYQPGGSHWYFPQAHRLDQHGKYLLMSPGKDRSAAIGFRCVVDAPTVR